MLLSVVVVEAGLCRDQISRPGARSASSWSFSCCCSSDSRCETRRDRVRWGRGGNQQTQDRMMNSKFSAVLFLLKNTTKVGERQQRRGGSEPAAPAKVESKLGSNKEIKSKPDGCGEEGEGEREEGEMDLEAEGEMKSCYLRGGIWPLAGTVIYQSHSTNGHQWRSARRLQDKTSIRLSSSHLAPLSPATPPPANQRRAS